MMHGVTEQVDRELVSARALRSGFAIIRILFGAIWLSNGLAKVLLNQNNSVDWGFVSFNLINQPAAKGILDDASRNTFQPLRWIYQDFVLPNWGFFQWLLTIAEIAAGLALILGIASRLAPLVGLVFVGPIWIMLLDRNLYLWEYPLELLPLLVLVFVPTGRTFGQDRKLAARFGGRWPF